MLTKHALPVRRALAAGVALVAVGLSMLACGTSSTGQAATAEPVLHAFVGRFAGQPALKVALLVGRDSSVAYLCDNHSGGVLLRGRAQQRGSGGTAELTADDGITLSAGFDARQATGAITLPGRAAAAFTAQLATGAAGLYEAAATAGTGSLQGRWIVGNDGQVAGMLRLNGQPVANPALQPTVTFSGATSTVTSSGATSTVTFGRATLVPLPVRALPVQLTPPPAPAPGPVPVIDNAFSWRCGGDFHVDGTNFNPSAPVQILVDLTVPEVNLVYNPPLVPPNGANGNLDADFAYVLGPKPLTTDKNAVVQAVEFPGQPSAVSAHTSAYIC